MPLVWTNFQRGIGGSTYVLARCPWPSFTMLDSDEDGMVSILMESHFYRKCLNTCEFCSLSDLIRHTWRKPGHLDQNATGMAPLAHLPFYNPTATHAFCSHVCKTLWGKWSSSSYLTHEEMETVSSLLDGRQNCHSSWQHKPWRQMDVGWVPPLAFISCVTSSTHITSLSRDDCACTHRLEGKSCNSVCKMPGPVLGILEMAVVIYSKNI